MNLESILEQFGKPLKDFIKSRVKTDQDAEDILQDVFYKIYKNLDHLNDTNKIYAWIYQITKNAIIDYYRNNKSDNANLDHFEENIDGTYEEVNANEEISQCIKTMINSLPEKYKQALILTEFQNLTQKELAEKMGLSVSGAKSRVQRARIKLKELLLGCCRLEFDHYGNVIDYEHKCSDCKFC